MINKITSTLQLACLCFRLTSNILFFGLKLLLIRVKAHKINPVLFVICLLLIWLGNLLIYNKKSTPQTEIILVPALKQSPNISLTTKRFLLTKNNVKNLLTTYTELEKKDVKNLGLYLNLSQLENVNGNEQLAQEYLEQAKNIAP